MVDVDRRGEASNRKLKRSSVRTRRLVAKRKAKLSGGQVLKRRARMRFAKRSAKTIFVAKAGPRSRRHITAPATASQITKSLGFTRNDVAQARALIDRLGL